MQPTEALDWLCDSGHKPPAHPHHLPLAGPGVRQDRGPGRPAPQPPPQIIERTNREHPYEVLSVVAVPIVGGGPDYIRWILDKPKRDPPSAQGAGRSDS